MGFKSYLDPPKVPPTEAERTKMRFTSRRSRFQKYVKDAVAKAEELFDREKRTGRTHKLEWMDAGTHVAYLGMKGLKLLDFCREIHWAHKGHRTKDPEVRIWALVEKLAEYSIWLRKGAEKKGIPTDMFPVFFSPLKLDDHPLYRKEPSDPE